MALVVVAVAYAVTVVLSLPGLRGQVAGLPAWAATLLEALVLLGPLLVGALVAARLGGPQIGRALGIRFRVFDLLPGALVALVARAVMEIVAPSTGSLLPMFGEVDAVATLTATIVVVVVLAPVVEELFFRGALQRAFEAVVGDALAPRWAAVLAVAISTVAFVLLHAAPYGAQVPVNVILPPLLIGVGAGALTAATGRIAAGVVAHVLFNLAGVLLLLG